MNRWLMIFSVISSSSKTYCTAQCSFIVYSMALSACMCDRECCNFALNYFSIWRFAFFSSFFFSHSQPDADANEELPVHSRSGSAVSLNENHSYHNRPYNGNHQAVISHGKPSLAPKPPGFKAGSKNDGRSSVGRTLSLRLPRSPLSTTDVNNGKLTVRPRPAEKEGESEQIILGTNFIGGLDEM